MRVPSEKKQESDAESGTLGSAQLGMSVEDEPPSILASNDDAATSWRRETEEPGIRPRDALRAQRDV